MPFDIRVEVNRASDRLKPLVHRSQMLVGDLLNLALGKRGRTKYAALLDANQFSVSKRVLHIA
jgi:hypothetical protein